jgi:peptide chain release factor subunit 3|uniref:Tr-type G domain-containing protein n=1 Tax=Ostreococcus mediterraneus TaxID=1486918 RepID=A0A6U0F7V1_9CHLO|mmetsp:Transcript_5782/g.20934  ORF Transcript_5782/g.20934 Transcript_5782/m.20934 type:complete len:596 (+) Transcript_5782:962-2749(+)
MGDHTEDAAEEQPKPKLSANAAAFSFSPSAAAFEFKPRTVTPVTGGEGGAPPPPAGAPPAKAASLTIGGPAKEVSIGGPAKSVSIGGPAKAVSLSIGGPAKEVSIGGPAKAAAEPAAAAETATEAKESPVAAKVVKVAQKVEELVIEDEPVEEEEDASFDAREHLNLVFIGHVDAGKSTIGGQILFLSGQVDDRVIQKYEREAKEKNRDSWYMAYIMDTSEEERAKGKTVEVGRANFETEKKRYTVLDAPGHKNYVPNMIAGTAQADVGVLVISSRKGEFETGFDKGGQTREHAQLAKTLGVSKLVVVINKMDDPSTNWDKERYDEIKTKLSPFLKQCGYKLDVDVSFCPISGLTGANMKNKVSADVCPWYDGKSLFDTLDDLQTVARDPAAPFRMPVMDKYNESGAMVMGKIESGTCRVGQTLMLMPNKAVCKVAQLFRDEVECKKCLPGENVRLKVTGVNESDIQPGFVFCGPKEPIHICEEIECQLALLELLEHNSVFTKGYKAVIHIHSATEEVEVTKLVSEIDPKTRKPKEGKPRFLKSGSLGNVRIRFAQPVCVEKFADYAQLGRFTLRDEGRTIAIGKVTRLKPVSSE